MTRRTLIIIVLVLGIGIFVVMGASNTFFADQQFPSDTEKTPLPETIEAGIGNRDTGTFLARLAEAPAKRVTRVVDGDTIELEDGNPRTQRAEQSSYDGTRVRYIGMDAPETVDPRKPVQCFGEEASARNKELVEGKRVRLEKDVSETDKYGRLLRYVYVDNKLVNLILIQEGFSHSYTYPPDVSHQQSFVAAERLAREGKKGLWGGCPLVKKN